MRREPAIAAQTTVRAPPAEPKARRGSVRSAEKLAAETTATLNDHRLPLALRGLGMHMPKCPKRFGRLR